jgi:hypothetical protein
MKRYTITNLLYLCSATEDSHGTRPALCRDWENLVLPAQAYLLLPLLIRRPPRRRQQQQRTNIVAV